MQYGHKRSHPRTKAFQQVYVRTAPPPDKNLKVSVMNSLKPCSNYSAVWLRRESCRVDKAEGNYTQIISSHQTVPRAQIDVFHWLQIFCTMTICRALRQSHTHMRFGLISA